MNLGDRIIKIREENKLSQEELAEKLNVTRQTVSNWENYKNYPDIETLIKISDEFNISLDNLLKGDKNMVNKIDKDIKENRNKRIILIFFLLIIMLLGIFIIKLGYDKKVDFLKSNIAEMYRYDVVNYKGENVIIRYTYEDDGEYINGIGVNTRFKELKTIKGTNAFLEELNMDLSYYNDKYENEVPITYVLDYINNYILEKDYIKVVKTLYRPISLYEQKQGYTIQEFEYELEY